MLNDEIRRKKDKKYSIERKILEDGIKKKTDWHCY